MNIIWFFSLTLAVLGLRLIVIAILASVQRVRSRPIPDVDYAPPLTVLIPAYNEEKVITATVHSVLASDYPNFRVIVINDGSTDGTLHELQQRFRGNAQVTIVDQPKQGKAN